MAETKITHTSAGTDIAITSADGNGDGVWCSSALVDNASNVYMDALVNGSIQTGTLAAVGTIDFYVAGSADGVEFTAGVDAGDVDITWGTTGSTHVDGEKDLLFLGSASTAATDDDNDIVFGPFSIADKFGGAMPMEWCIVIENNTGAALHATGTNNHLEYTGITYTSA